MKKLRSLPLLGYPALITSMTLLALAWPTTAALAACASTQPVLAIRLNYASTDALLATLTSTGITAAYPKASVMVQADETAHLVVVCGPPSDITRVSQIARELEHIARERIPTAVRVVKLSAARAADQTEYIAGQPTVLPGVATHLRHQFTSKRSLAALKTLTALKAKLAHTPLVPVEYELPLPIIEADPRTNSVLIRDRPPKLDTDTAFITSLDTRPEVVQITAILAEVDANALAILPLPWQSANASTRFALLDSNHNPGNDSTTLATQLKRFAADGRARIEFERSVLTVDRTPALIGRYEDRLVQAANAGEQPLLELSSGVALNVTPVISAASKSPTINRSERPEGSQQMRAPDLTESAGTRVDADDHQDIERLSTLSDSGLSGMPLITLIAQFNMPGAPDTTELPPHD